MSTPIVKFVRLHPDVLIPEKKSAEAACYDVFSYLQKPYLLKPMERAAIATGLQLEIPPNFQISVRPRSGLALKEGLTLANSPGTIDEDFRGELKIIVINLSDKNIIIEKRQRIAQILLEKVEEFIFEEIKPEQLSQTARGEQGFGSTGKH